MRALKAILQERRDIRKWVDVVPAVQWALNMAYRERYASPPHDVIFGRAPLTSFLTMASSTGGDWKVYALDEEALRRNVTNVVEAQQRLHKVVEEQVKKNRERQREQLPNCAVGGYVMVARVWRPGSTPTLVIPWTSPWRIVTADKIYLYGVQNIIMGEVNDVYVVCLRFYAYKHL